MTILETGEPYPAGWRLPWGAFFNWRLVAFLEMKQSDDPQTRYDFLFIARPKKYRRTKSSPWKGILSCSRFSSPACVAGSNMPKTGVGTFAIVVDSKSVKAAFQSIGGTMEAVQNAAGAYGVGCTRWKAVSLRHESGHRCTLRSPQ